MNTTSSMYAQSVPSMPPQAVRRLDDLSARLGESLKRATDLRDRARSIADDVFGAATAGSSITFSASGGQPGLVTVPARGRTASLEDAVTQLNDVLSSLAVEVDRLTCL
jgi:hypothetical protein